MVSHGSVELVRGEFRSKAIGDVARFHALVPESGKSAYPVLYLHHGLGDDAGTFLRATDLERYAAAHDLIVVTPDAGSSWFCNDPRAPGRAWEDHLACELVDWVDRELPAIASREGRGQAGFSMGGYGAMMLALRHPDRFSLACSMAGSFAFGHELRPDRPERSRFMQAVAPPGGDYDLWELAPRLADSGARLTVRIDVGTSDHLLEFNRRFHALLDRLGVEHEYEETRGGHEWGWVDRRLPGVLGTAAAGLEPAS